MAEEVLVAAVELAAFALDHQHAGRRGVLVGRVVRHHAEVVVLDLDLAQIRGPDDVARTLARYIDLLFIPLFAILMRDEARRRAALLGLAASLVLTLALSYLLAAGAPLPRWIALGDATNPAVFKHYLTHGILLAFGAFLFVELAFVSTIPAQRTAWLVLSGKRINAKQALAWGLVNEVVAPASCRDRALELARSLLECGPQALTTTKRVLDEATSRPADLLGAAAVWRIRGVL